MSQVANYCQEKIMVGYCDFVADRPGRYTRRLISISAWPVWAVEQAELADSMDGVDIGQTPISLMINLVIIQPANIIGGAETQR